MATVGFRPDAIQDIKEHFEYRSDYSEKAVKRFRERFDEIIDRLSEYPESGRERSDISPLLRGFPIRALRVTVFYTFDKKRDAVIVSHVLRWERDIDDAFNSD